MNNYEEWIQFCMILLVGGFGLGLFGYSEHYPNIVHKVDCEIKTNNVTTIYGARKTQCFITSCHTFILTCQNNIFLNIT